MDQAVTRAAGATPSATTPAAAAPRLVGEFLGYVDGQPSVVWADRKNMPEVGSKLYALPPRTAVPRTWALLLTSPNHGVVGAAGSQFDSVPENYERVQVVEIVEAGAAPAPGTDLAGLVRLPLTNEQIAAGAAVECDHGAPIGRNAAIDVFDAMCAAAPVAAQAGQVAPAEDDLLEVVRTLCSIAERRAALPGEKRKHYPHADEEGSPVLTAARAACLARGYTEDGLEVEGVSYPVVAAGQVAVPEVDTLANFIRQVDGDHKMGAGALAEKIVDWLTPSPAKESK